MQKKSRTNKRYSKGANQAFKATQSGRQLSSVQESEFLSVEQEQALAKLIIDMIYGNSATLTERATRLGCNEQSLHIDTEGCHNIHLDLKLAKEELIRIARRQPQRYSGDYQAIGTLNISEGQLKTLFSNESRLNDLIDANLNGEEIGAELNVIRNRIFHSNLDLPEPPLSAQTLLIGGVATAMVLSCAFYGIYMIGGAVAKSATKIGDSIFGFSAFFRRPAATGSIQALEEGSARKLHSI